MCTSLCQSPSMSVQMYLNKHTTINQINPVTTISSYSTTDSNWIYIDRQKEIFSQFANNAQFKIDIWHTFGSFIPEDKVNKSIAQSNNASKGKGIKHDKKTVWLHW